MKEPPRGEAEGHDQVYNIKWSDICGINFIILNSYGINSITSKALIWLHVYGVESIKIEAYGISSFSVYVYVFY